MVDIVHRVGIKASREAVFAALTTLEGIAGWWTRDLSGDAGQGGAVEVRFGPGTIGLRVRETRAPEWVLWDMVDQPAEWVGTQVTWELRTAGDYTIVLFGHRGWREPVEFMYHCSTKWAIFLMSLKQLVETGEGKPAPDDVQISDWH